MHLDLHDMNGILDQTIQGDERLACVSHLVECTNCQRRFQVLHGLHQRQRREARRSRLMVWGAAAAAVLVGFLGVLGVRSPIRPDAHPPILAQSSMPTEQPQELDVLAQVQRVNLKRTLPDWGKTENMMDLVRKTKRAG